MSGGLEVEDALGGFNLRDIGIGVLFDSIYVNFALGLCGGAQAAVDQRATTSANNHDNTKRG